MHKDKVPLGEEYQQLCFWPREDEEGLFLTGKFFSYSLLTDGMCTWGFLKYVSLSENHGNHLLHDSPSEFYSSTHGSE